MFKKISVIFLAVVLTVSFMGISSFGNIKVKGASLSEQKAASAKAVADFKAKLSEYKGQEDKLLDEISKVQDQINSLDKQILGYNDQIGKINTKISAKEKEISVLEATYNKNVGLIKANMVDQYVNGDINPTTALLTSANIDEFIAFSEYYNVVKKDQESVMAEIKKEKDVIDAKKKELQAQEDSLVSVKSKVESAKNTQGIAKAELTDNKAEVDSIIGEYTKKIAAENAHGAQIQDSIKASIATQAASGIIQPNYAGSGVLAWPVPSSRNITSAYGPRVGGKHRGIDIGCNIGSPVVAAESGTVISESPDPGGFGNYIVINHGSGFLTLYGHLSSKLVTSGQHVSRGQEIALSGNSGGSSGPHLHFGMTKSGDIFRGDVNPIGNGL